MLLVSLASHVPVTPEHLHEAPYVGALFIALMVACFVLAVGMAVADSRTVWAAAGVVTALAFAAYIVSRSVGLPQMADDIGNWAEPLGLVAITAEALTVVASAAALAASYLETPTHAETVRQ